MRNTHALVLAELQRRGSATTAELAKALGLDWHQVIGVLRVEEGRRTRKTARLMPDPRHPRQVVWVWGYVPLVPFGMSF